jgi:hypothetical protein
LPKIVGFGASNFDGIAWAWEQRDPASWRAFTFGCLRFRDFDGSERDKALGVGSAFLPALARELRDPETALMFCSVGGGEHVTVGLINSPRKFDIIVPDAEADAVVLRLQAAAPAADSREIIPYDVMKQNFRWRVGGIVPLFRTVRALSPHPLYCISPPPPIRDPAQMELTANAYADFRKAMDAYGLNDPCIYYKTWLIHKIVMQEYCRECGVGFIDPPAQAVGADGFLRAEFFLPADPMHANRHYGALVIDQVTQLAVQRR